MTINTLMTYVVDGSLAFWGVYAGLSWRGWRKAALLWQDNSRAWEDKYWELIDKER